MAEQIPASRSTEVEELESRVRRLEAELQALRTAHEAQARFLVQERLAIADEVEAEVATLREEIEWRKEHEELLKTLQGSRSMRLTEPFRKLASVLRRR